MGLDLLGEFGGVEGSVSRPGCMGVTVCDVPGSGGGARSARSQLRGL